MLYVSKKILAKSYMPLTPKRLIFNIWFPMEKKLHIKVDGRNPDITLKMHAGKNMLTVPWFF